MQQLQLKSISMILLYLITITSLQAAPESKPPSSVSENINFCGQWFLAWQHHSEEDSALNEFTLKRGYVTIQKTFNDRFSARITQDITVDQEGDGQGDIEIRLKYGYLRYSFHKLLFFNKPFLEVGLVHRPWIDFEQKVNRYRVQGNMYLERNSLLCSADYGIIFSALIGESLNDEFRRSVNNNFPGEYGSFAVGIFNGAGYDVIENNNNKLIEGRLSLRPIPRRMPGLQCHYIGAYGRGNSAAAPDFTLNAFSLTLESRNIVLISTLYTGKGDALGTLIDEHGASLRQNGHSQFLELRLGRTGCSLFGRYDLLRTQLSGDDRYQECYIIGAACSIFENARLVADLDYLISRHTRTQHQKTFEIAIEFTF